MFLADLQLVLPVLADLRSDISEYQDLQSCRFSPDCLAVSMKSCIFALNMGIENNEMNYKGLMSDNGYSYPSVQMQKNIFASSCVEAVASKMHVSTTEAYRRMKNVELFRDVIFPCYETLHSQSREIATEDILEAMIVRESKLKNNK